MIAPIEIALDHPARTLTLRWSDGASQRIDYAQLRGGCPCAECRKIRLDGGHVDARQPHRAIARVRARRAGAPASSRRRAR
ncbi:gamma-butyrobetaine hydroxylase-like domain-containing protein, partial [Burkholderia cenocepacia]|uniref:gamma-butyrobetaine hydroxylase-like domain-containing protein n=1 Tax=Burkholderia cenocepacia TaxID=95486 RepID=UPI0024B684FD